LKTLPLKRKRFFLKAIPIFGTNKTQMKRVFSLLLSLCLIGGVMAQEPLPAKKIMKDAYDQATKENKQVMVIFHASWCGWCHRMDSIMNMPTVKPMFDKYFVIKHIVVLESAKKKNLENPGGDQLMKKFNGAGSGIPYWVILDAKGKILGDSRMPTKNKAGKDIKSNVGCPAQPNEIEYFIGLLKKTTSLSDQDLQTISALFTLKKTTAH